MARAWARPDETLYFWVRFAEGSHLKITWEISEPDIQDDCRTEEADAIPLESGVAWEAGKKDCIFPFRYNRILYYGCTNTGICATKVDSDYNAETVGSCNDDCHTQKVRPEEQYANATSEFVEAQEGSEIQKKEQYIKPYATELELKRTFSQPGFEYHIEMEAENLHNPDDTASFRWIIQCGVPIKPEDWTLSVPPAIHIAEYFTINLTVKAGVNLPTKPVIRLTPIVGMQRIDNDISIDNSTSIKVLLKYNLISRIFFR